MLPDLDGTVLWLMPDQKGSATLQGMITSLAREVHSPGFLPHVTLARLPAVSAAGSEEWVTWIARQSPSFHITVDSAECRNHPYQKIVLPFKKPKPLDQAIHALEQKTGDKQIRREDFHFSLLYSRLPCDALRKQVGKVRFQLPLRVTIQKVAVVQLAVRPEDWTIISSADLGGKPPI